MRGIAPGLVEVPGTHLAVELRPLLLHAVEERVEARLGGALVDVEDDGEVGPTGGVGGGCPSLRRLRLGFWGTGGSRAAGGFAHGVDFGFGQAAGGALVGEGGRDEAVGEDEFTAGEGGADGLLDELCAAGHVEEHLAAEGHFRMDGVEEDVADALADGGAARLADLADGEALRAAEFDEAAELSGLARAVGPFEDDEAAGEGAEEQGIGESVRHGADCSGTPIRPALGAVRLAQRIGVYNGG